jgi:small neutral amino acid transporter SnatA (MarC family)
MAILAVRHESFDVAAGVLSFTSALSCIYSSAPLDFGIRLHDTDH